jgi:hypothetical protein
MATRRNFLPLAGFLVCLVGFFSYFFLFVRFLRRVPGARISPPSPEPPRRPPKEPNPVVKPLRSCFEEAPEMYSRSDTRHQFRRLAAKVLLRRHLSLHPRLRRTKNLLFRPNPRRRVYPPTNGSADGKHPRGKPGLGSPLWSFSAAVR